MYVSGEGSVGAEPSVDLVYEIFDRIGTLEQTSPEEARLEDTIFGGNGE